MKELISKPQETTKILSKYIQHNKINIFDLKIIAEEFNTFFINMKLRIASKTKFICDISVLHEFIHHVFTRKRPNR